MLKKLNPNEVSRSDLFCISTPANVERIDFLWRSSFCGILGNCRFLESDVRYVSGREKRFFLFLLAKSIYCLFLHRHFAIERTPDTIIEA